MLACHDDYFPSSWLSSSHTITTVAALTNRASLSSTPSFYKIVGVSGGTQHLPASYVQSFQQWRLSYVDEQDNNKQSLHKIDFTKRHLSDSALSPVETLIQPTLDVLLKGGVPAYLLAGLEVAIASRNSSTGSSDWSTSTGTSTTHILAQQWTSFSMAVDPHLRLMLYQGPADGTDERLALVTTVNIKAAIERFGQMLSRASSSSSSSNRGEEEELVDLSNGFHIVSIPLATTTGLSWIPFHVTEPGHTTSMSEADACSNQNLFLTCFLTAEPDPRELFQIDPELLEMTATSFLQINSNVPLVHSDTASSAASHPDVN